MITLITAQLAHINRLYDGINADSRYMSCALFFKVEDRNIELY